MPNPDEPRSAAEIEAELATIQDPVDPVEPEASDDPAEAARLEAETLAVTKGWVPKDQFKGPPEKWVDAKTFNDRGDKFNKNLQRQVEQLTAKLESFEGTKAAFKKYHEETVAKKDAEIANAIKALRVQRSEAQSEGEHDTVVAIEDRIDVLNAERKAIAAVAVDAPAQATAPGDIPANLKDPVLQEWIEDGNDWFDTNPKLRDYAVALGETLIKQGTTLRGRKFLDLVADHMKENFPRSFRTPSPAASRAPAAEGSGSTRGAGAGGAGGRSEADLPAEDRALMKQFIKEGWTTKEKFLQSYFSR